MTRATAIPETVALHLAFRIVKRGGRKEMQLPPGAMSQHKTYNTLSRRCPAPSGGSACLILVSSGPSPNWPSAKESRPPT